MKNVVEKLKNKIIISCQSSRGEPIYEENAMPSIIKSVINGGAGGLRLAGIKDIEETCRFSSLPVIGITKPDPLPENWKEIVYITPTFKDAKQISDAGADIIAIDGTFRPRPKESLAELISQIHSKLKKPVMADCATFEEGINAASLGADIISTTLSGYTVETLEKNNGEPDFGMLEKLVKELRIPIITEGRIWTVEHARKAFDLGAYAVVIGSAVTRPQLITKRFVGIIV